MSLDDLLGLLFLLIFVVGPVLKGLLQGSEETPLLEPEEAPTPPPKTEEARAEAAKPEPPPAPEPGEAAVPDPAAGGREAVKPELAPAPKPLPEAEGLRLEPMAKAEAVRAPQPAAARAPEAPPPKPKRKRFGLSFTRGGILEGVVWHEILSEPRARRRWKPKR